MCNFIFFFQLQHKWGTPIQDFVQNGEENINIWDYVLALFDSDKGVYRYACKILQINGFKVEVIELKSLKHITEYVWVCEGTCVKDILAVLPVSQ